MNPSGGWLGEALRQHEETARTTDVATLAFLTISPWQGCRHLASGTDLVLALDDIG